MKFYLMNTIILVLLSSLSQANGQDEKLWKFNGSFGFGFSTISNMPDEIYNQGRENIQLGLLLERKLNEKFSLVSMAEVDFLNYSFDGYFRINEPDDILVLEQASPGVKYTGLRQTAIGWNLLARYHFKKKTYQDDECIDGGCTKVGALFLQGGVRLSSPLNTVYYFRENNERNDRSLSDHTNMTLFQAELSIGVKGRLNNIFSILNSSTVGLIYQFTPIFKAGQEVPNLNPVHVSWRFLL